MRRVTWNYQYVVPHDFLEKLLDAGMYKTLKEKASIFLGRRQIFGFRRGI